MKMGWMAVGHSTWMPVAWSGVALKASCTGFWLPGLMLRSIVLRPLEPITVGRSEAL